MSYIKLMAAFLAAALITSILASIISSQYVIYALSHVGASIDLGQRGSMTWADLAILQTLMPVVMACFLIGFLIAFACHRFFSGPRWLWHVAAGFTSLVCTLLLMSWVLQLMPVAGARSTSGLLLMGISGAFGGWVFNKLSQTKKDQIENR